MFRKSLTIIAFAASASLVFEARSQESCVAEQWPHSPRDANSLFEAQWNPEQEAVELYDRETCEFWDEITSPNASDEGFGASLTLSEPAIPAEDQNQLGMLWVGAPGRVVKICRSFWRWFCPSLSCGFCGRSYHGVVYGFQLDYLNTSWGRQGSVMIENPVAFKKTGFGRSVAADRDLVAVGAPGKNLVYIYPAGGRTPIVLRGDSVAGPYRYDNGAKEVYALRGWDQFGTSLSLVALEDQLLGQGRQLLRSRLAVGSQKGQTCFELTALTEVFDPDADCSPGGPAPVPGDDVPPPPPGSGPECDRPLPPIDWTVRLISCD